VRKEAGSVLIPHDAGPRMGTVIPAKFPFGYVVTLDDKASPRVALAEWLTSPKNSQFARATVNRLWAQLFGRGLVHPVDSLDAENLPSHPELLDTLAGELIASGYDMKLLIRSMLLSRAYQRSHVAVKGNEHDETLLSHTQCKVVAPETLYESLVLVSGNDLSKGDPGVGNGRKGRGVLGSRSEFLKLFATSNIDDSPFAYTQGIPQVLALLNDAVVNQPNRLVEQAVKEGGSPDDIVTRIFLSVLSRRPREDDLKLTREFVAGRKSPLEAYQAVWWALINSPEFTMIP
jgi:hypothetical protein